MSQYPSVSSTAISVEGNEELIVDECLHAVGEVKPVDVILMWHKQQVKKTVWNIEGVLGNSMLLLYLNDPRMVLVLFIDILLHIR